MSSVSAPELPYADLIVLDAAEIVTVPPDAGPERPDAAAVGALRGAALAAAGGRVLWVGPQPELARAVRWDERSRVLDATGCVVTPGWVDCHTHLVHGGERAAEFHLRNRGATYLEIGAAGGGILSTVRATRVASEDELVRRALPRLRSMLARGVTCCEVKSGYGLDLATELKILRAARRLAALQPVRIVTTFLGAHTVPPEYRERRASYVDLVVEEMIPAVVEQGLAEACDVFCERGVFDVAESERVLRAAQDAGLRLHVHAEQFTSFGGAGLAARLGASSADHLEAVDDEGAAALAAAGVVAVGLPGCNLFLDQAARLPARRLLQAGVRVALATDFNPGTSHGANLPLMMTLGCAWLRLSAAEALAAVTAEAARALGRSGELGSLLPGARADLVAYPLASHEHLAYAFGELQARWVVVDGQQVFAA